MTLPFRGASFPELYEQLLVGPLFRPWAHVILDEARPTRGERVLDVACGTGIVARLAFERLGKNSKVVGVDASAPMIAMAHSLAPQIDWRVGDAAALPLREGETFDVVVCQQGLQFFPDRVTAARQMRGALSAGGRLAVSTWRPDEQLPVLLELRRIAERHLGPIMDRRHALGDARLVEALLRDGGFRDIRSRVVSRSIRFEEGNDFVRMNAMALLGMSSASGASESERERLLEAVVRDSAALVRERSDAHGFSYEIAAVVATARR